MINTNGLIYKADSVNFSIKLLSFLPFHPFYRNSLIPTLLVIFQRVHPPEVKGDKIMVANFPKKKVFSKIANKLLLSLIFFYSVQ